MKDYIRIIPVCLLTMMTLNTNGQEVSFRSPIVEGVVRHHLNIDEEAVISFSQLDTITHLDLSRHGVTDIGDLMLMPRLQILDLRDNMVNDLRPIAMLDSLVYVDLSCNSLKSVNILFSSMAKDLTINVAYNHIKDFSLFCSASSSNITLNGTGLQLYPDAPYFDVYQFYADVNDAGTAKVSWRGYTNLEETVTVVCGALSVQAQMDGYTNSVALPRELDATTQAVLSNGEVGDTTYVVPAATHIVKGGDKVTIETALPEHYRIGYLRALHGSVEADGKVLHYTAPSPIEADTLYMSYYEGNRIRGFAQMYFMTQDFYDGVKDIDNASTLKVTLRDGVLRIAGITARRESPVTVKVYDAMGRMLETLTAIDSQHIVMQLPASVYMAIVEVTSAGKRTVTKVSAK